VTNSTLQVLILGATGVFGSRLVERLAREPGIAVTLAARDRARLEALRDRNCPSASIRTIDRTRIVAGDLAGIDVVVDAAGPFQGSDHQVIETALAARVDYVDLADGREFVASIAEFDSRARTAGLRVICGASSVPALSDAAVACLTAGWQAVDTIKVGIFPGNRAPRGLAVVEAILSYAGRPVRVFREGRWQEMPGWGGTHRWPVTGHGRRWASVCDTPDQDLLVQRHRPRLAAEFYAGTELSVMHLGLLALSLPVRWGLVPSLRPAARVLHWLATRLVTFGHDMGAMEVRVTGLTADGIHATAGWTLLAGANRGPYVPVLPCLALLRHLRDGRLHAKGASACVDMLDLDDFAADFAALGIETRVWSYST
jgi:hypothetical protein